MEILIISGLSGAGKSSAATYLEDMGYYTVDNVPADIILKFAEFCAQSDGRYDRVALVSDIRSGNGNFQGILDAMERLKQGGDICRLLFVTADLETIIKRYKETRRRHPLMSDGMTIEQAMHREQELLRHCESTPTLSSTRRSCPQPSSEMSSTVSLATRARAAS